MREKQGEWVAPISVYLKEAWNESGTQHSVMALRIREVQQIKKLQLFPFFVLKLKKLKLLGLILHGILPSLTVYLVCYYIQMGAIKVLTDDIPRIKCVIMRGHTKHRNIADSDDLISFIEREREYATA